MPIPTELRLQQTSRILNVSFDDGKVFALPYQYLRVYSPSAEVQGHGPGQEKLVTGKQKVDLTRIEPVGNYAVKLVFSDGHASGLYTWDYLYQLGEQQTVKWQAYLDKLQAKGEIL
jgi:DUF971 family protein